MGRVYHNIPSQTSDFERLCWLLPRMDFTVRMAAGWQQYPSYMPWGVSVIIATLSISRKMY
jgi:hypothetical protein